MTDAHTPDSRSRTGTHGRSVWPLVRHPIFKYMKHITEFKTGTNPAGVACLFQKHGSQFAVLAPDLPALRKVMKGLGCGEIDGTKCKGAKLAHHKDGDSVFSASND